MREREKKTAERLGLFERVEALEEKLLAIDHVVGVDFDLDGLADLHQVIFLPKYDIPVSSPNYYDVRREMLRQVLDVAKEFGLSSSGDRIEDYGEHFYIVRNCDETWKQEQTETRDGSDGGRRSLRDLIDEAEGKKGGPDDGGPGGAVALEDPKKQVCFGDR